MIWAPLLQERTMTAEMTDIERPRRRARRAVASLLTLTLLTAGAAACAQEADNGSITMEPVDNGTDDGGGSSTGGGANFQATTEFLKESATRTEDASRRIEMRVALGDSVPEDTPPMMQGEVDGDQFHYTMDLGPVMDMSASMVGGGVDAEDILGDLDLTMEMIGTGDTWYIRAPMFADLSELAGGAGVPGFEELSALGDGWGSIDVASLGDVLPGDLSSSVLGQGGVDPTALIDMVTNAENVEDLGTDTIRDVEVHGLRAEVTMADMLEASGQDPDALAQVGGVGSDAEDMMQTLIDTPTSVEVWIDGDGYLARMTYGLSFDEIFDAMGVNTDDAAGSELPSLDSLDFAYSLDMFDYGETFAFDPPADATDVTDAFAEIYQA
jgi:hypothetical protein